jgi:hypothetical protein
MNVQSTDGSSRALLAVPAPRSPVTWRAPGGIVPSDDDLIERTLAFSGSHVSDDGHVTIRRSSGPHEYSGSRFAGHCDVCSRTGRTAPGGEPLSDVRAAVQFVAAHTHGDVD